MHRSQGLGRYSGYTRRCRGLRMVGITAATILLLTTAGGLRGGPVAALGGHDGPAFDSLAIGAPWEDLLEYEDGGIVQVLLGSSEGLSDQDSEIWHQDSPDVGESMEPFDRLGFSLASGDFNGDDLPDLAIGVPGEDLGDREQAGAVHVLYGAQGGLSVEGNQVWTQDSPGLLDEVEADDLFGWALAAADLNRDGYADLAIGAPGEALGDRAAAGVVQVLYGSPVGLRSEGNQLWSQDSPSVAEEAQANDYFGMVLAAGHLNGDIWADLVISAPHENLEVRNAGVVHVLYGSSAGLAAEGNQLWHQGLAAVADEAEEGDRFGRALAIGDLNGDRIQDLAVGVPDEGLGEIRQAGIVQVLYGSSGGLTSEGQQVWHQDSPEVTDTAEEEDKFGWALAAGDLDGDGMGDLAVGVLGEDLGGALDCGAVQVLYGSTMGLAGARNQLWHQNSPSVADDNEQGDQFGAALTAGDYDGDGFSDLAIGVPDEEVRGLAGAGVVHILRGSAAGLSAQGSQLWDQDAIKDRDSCEADDAFGSALATLHPKLRGPGLYLPLVLRR